MNREPADPVADLFRGLASPDDLGEHLDEEAMSALLEAATPGDADPAATGHLASCDVCRREWIELRRAGRALAGVDELSEAPWEVEREVQGRSPRTPASGKRAAGGWTWRILAGAGALSILVGIAVILPRDPAPDADVMRSSEAAVPLRPLAPDGPWSAGGLPEFRWSALDDATVYEIVVADAGSGDTVLRIRAGSSPRRLTEDEAASLVPGREYRWLVRAELGVGRSRTGPAASFRLSE